MTRPSTHSPEPLGKLRRRSLLLLLMRGLVALPVLGLPACAGETARAGATDVREQRHAGEAVATVIPLGPLDRVFVVVAASDAPALERARADYVCDGVDDHIQIQAALEALPSAGGTVSLTAGLFTGGRISMPSKTSLSGQGPTRTTYRLAEGANDHCMLNSDLEGGNVQIGISDITFDFNGAAQSADTHGIRFQRVTDLQMTDVVLRNAYHHNLVSIAPVAAGENARWHITRCVSTGAGRGPAVHGDGFRPSDGFTMGSDGARLVDCIAVGNSHHGFHLGARCIAVGGSADANDAANLYLPGEQATAMNVSATNHGPSGSPALHNVSVSGRDCRVLNCRIVGSGSAVTDALRIVGDGGVTISGNTVVDSRRYGIRVDAGGCVIERNVTSRNARGNFFETVPRSKSVVRNNVGFPDRAAARLDG